MLRITHFRLGPEGSELLDLKPVLGLEMDAKTFVRAENAVPLMLQPAQARPVLTPNCGVMSGLPALNYPSHSHRLFERRDGIVEDAARLVAGHRHHTVKP